ncbi:hypothetical protein ACFSL4_21045 [Streptomyces caeni]|uniref:Uncharacterized protein n=1 Tax=Streptomyces caeni TaxID=2307231 RepID=A0ABW4IV43_9ACTN
MGNRPSRGRTFGPRLAYPRGHVRGAGGEVQGATAPLVTRALTENALTPESERRATAAFRAARDAGVHKGAHTRRRDDWRPHARGGVRCR